MSNNVSKGVCVLVGGVLGASAEPLCELLWLLWQTFAW